MLIGTLSQVSNRATWEENYQIFDSETGDSIDLGDVDEITLEVRDPDTRAAVLSATLTDGDIEILGDDEDGTFQWRFEASEMRVLSAKTYEVGCVIEADDDEAQLLVGALPVIDGIVA